MSDYSYIGDNISFWRGKCGLTITAIAEKTGLSISYISDIERHRTTPSIPTLDKIAGALGVDICVLLRDPYARLNDMTPDELARGEVR